MADAATVSALENFDLDQANAEGWTVSERDDGRIELQKYDDAEAFGSDGAAAKWVRWRAGWGSSYHRAALNLCD